MSLVISIALICYYSLITVGVGFAGIHLFRKIPFFSSLPSWVLLLLTATLLPALLSWAGFIGFFRYIPFSGQILGLFLAGYGIYQTYRLRTDIIRLIRQYAGTRTYLPLTLISVVFLLTYLIPHWRYLWGGSNNYVYDEIHGFSFT